MRVSIKWKFSGFLACLLLFTVLIISLLVLRGVASYQSEQQEKTMQQQSQLAQTRVTQQYVTGTRIDPKTFMRLQGQNMAVELGASSGMRVLLYNTDGETVGDSAPVMGQPSAADGVRYALQNKIATIAEGDTLLYVAPLHGPDEQLGAILFETSTAAQHAFFAKMLRLFMLAGIGVLAVSLAFGMLYMNKQARAIGLLKKSTDRIREGDYREPPTLRRQDELGELADGIGAMSHAIQATLGALHDEKEKLQEALEKLELLREQQKSFINSTNHELKTPLTSIKAYAELLMLYDDDPALVKEAREAIAKEADRLYKLVENVMQLARRDAYEFEHRPQLVELKALLADVCQRMKGKAETFNLSMDTQLEEAVVWADRDSLLHIFLNLVDNAIKYNVENGSVVVANRVQGDRVEVEVRDTGIGIPPAEREHVFLPFYTVNADRSRQSGGSGLGLALVKQLVEKQRGHIRVAEHDGNGTCVLVTLPLAPREKTLQVGNKLSSC